MQNLGLVREDGECIEMLKVLHVEDDENDANLLRHYLKKAYSPMKHDRVARLSDAADYLAKNTVDLVLLDLSLPDSSDIGAVQYLRDISPHIAIVVLSGFRDEESALEAVKNGAQDYLIKDKLDAETLLRVVRYSIERQRSEVRLLNMANHDVLTGLSNRAQFKNLLGSSISRVQRNHNAITVLFIDCDSFKLINDTHGHKAGDDFLKEIAIRIKSCIREADYAARFGGDEFLVVLENDSVSIQPAITVAERILQRIAKPFVLSDGESVRSSCSIGLSHVEGSQPDLDPDMLLRYADSAMYFAKKKGGNCWHFYDTRLDDIANRRIYLLRELEISSKTERFDLHYQPVYCSKTRRIKGFEALLRWSTSTGETISPAEFIPLLEETHFIKSVGKWVIEMACQQLSEWQKTGSGNEDLWVSVNVSPIQCIDSALIDIVDDALKANALNPQCLFLEITENLLLHKTEKNLKLLNALRDTGVNLAIDDFGVGFSSMEYLKNLPVSTLKIDRSFISNCLSDKADRVITSAIISLAHSLGLKVVAEGVESEDIFDHLLTEGCDLVQGYYFKRPLEKSRIVDLITCSEPSLIRDS